MSEVRFLLWVQLYILRKNLYFTDKKLGIFNSPVPVLDQYVLAEFIGSGNFVRHLNHVRRRLNAKT